MDTKDSWLGEGEGVGLPCDCIHRTSHVHSTIKLR